LTCWSLLCGCDRPVTWLGFDLLIAPAAGGLLIVPAGLLGTRT
jgi:hypothetical protein